MPKDWKKALTNNIVYFNLSFKQWMKLAQQMENKMDNLWHYCNQIFYLLSMEPWNAAKKTLSQRSGATSSCPSSWSMATYPERHSSHICRLVIRVMMRWNRRLCTELLVFTLRLRKTATRRPSPDEDSASNVVPYLQWLR